MTTLNYLESPILSAVSFNYREARDSGFLVKLESQYYSFNPARLFFASSISGILGSAL